MWNQNKSADERISGLHFQRGKEAAHDYRYFPDPDLVPVEVSDAMLEEIRAMLWHNPDNRPEGISDKRARGSGR